MTLVQVNRALQDSADAAESTSSASFEASGLLAAVQTTIDTSSHELLATVQTMFDTFKKEVREDIQQLPQRGEIGHEEIALSHAAAAAALVEASNRTLLAKPADGD